MRTSGWTFKDTESRTSHPVRSDRVGLLGQPALIQRVTLRRNFRESLEKEKRYEHKFLGDKKVCASAMQLRSWTRR